MVGPDVSLFRLGILGVILSFFYMELFFHRSVLGGFTSDSVGMLGLESLPIFRGRVCCFSVWYVGVGDDYCLVVCGVYFVQGIFL